MIEEGKNNKNTLTNMFDYHNHSFTMTPNPYCLFQVPSGRPRIFHTLVIYFHNVDVAYNTHLCSSYYIHGTITSLL